MKKKCILLLCAAIACLSANFLTRDVAAQKADGIYIIFDASGSMMGLLPDRSRKIDAAKGAVENFLQRDFRGYEIALRVYGHRRKEDCADSELLIPFGPPEKVAPALKSSIHRINAVGRTPITYSLEQALKDFGDRAGEIILISDGIESCEADPCALVREWKNRNVKIRVHVVGLGLGEKERATLRCISEAAGTEYRDASSTATLADELGRIQKQSVSAAFVLDGFDASGNPLKVTGILSREGREIHRVSSGVRSSVESGRYTLTAGVMTQNGNLYKPVTQTVDVAEAGETRVRVTAVLPPRVRARFTDRGEDVRGSLVRAFKEDKEVFSFRSTDEVYLDEGRYEFRARPNSVNDLSVAETFLAGDRKEIVFGLALSVKVTVKMTASGSGLWFRENYELWQNGEKKYPVHVINGARVVPGVYDLHLPNRLTPYVKKGVVVTDREEQHFDITVPVGHVTFVYQRADGSRDKDDRCFVSRAGGNERIFKMSGERHPLTPGRYAVTGWTQKGNYERVTFEIREGEDKTVALRAR
ncbi:MAG: hypothetical protein AB1631_01685 [Acidobacteriota bacterium]